MTVPPGSAPVRFAYWVPNVSGGLVTSTIEQRTDWGYDYNRELAVLGENNGFDYALGQVRYMASYGAEYQHESTGFSLALLLATQRLKVIAAVHPGLCHPGVLAEFGATADHLSNGRFAVNVVSGWFKSEFTALGEPWLEHDERYRRSEEFIRALRRIWTEDHAELAGDFYRLRGFSLKPKPLSTPERPHPEIFQGGNSTAARDTLREIVAKADTRAVHGFRDAVQQAGRSTADGKGMWQDSTFEDLVQYNDGFRTGLIGTPEQIAERIVAYKRLGVDLFLLGFLHYLEEVEHFGRRVLPLVREPEAREAGSAPPAARL
ncbi:LLM class flavin-dependent oxidoreductase [Streptomyces sp. NPDC000348]|uniref:LLM class flavin-dependent oxidoreductase n=1 Tax=Streptomyces sp. NPDC000348 TaxID=3364538 RepID=UPI0036A105DD